MAHFKHTKDKNRKFNFIGVIDKSKLERCGFGIEKNHCKEIYAGHHINDMREGRGVYKYKDIDDGKFTTSSIYMGYWNNNKKHGEGTFIWRKEENKKVKTFETCQLTAYVGYFYEDKYDLGIFCESGDDKTLSIYYGKFQENKKHDEEGIFYYESPQEYYVVVGNVEEDIVKEGCKFDFDPNEKMKFKHFNHFKVVSEEDDFDEDDDMYETIYQSDKEEEIEKQKDLMNKWTLAKQIFMVIQRERGDFPKIYNAALDGEKTYKDIKTLDDFYNKYAASLKTLQGETAIKVDDKIFKAIPKERKQIPTVRRSTLSVNR